MLPHNRIDIQSTHYGHSGHEGERTSVHIVVMGVSGCGKSTVASGLAERLHLPLAEADEFHSEGNRAKMAAGIPLDDADRRPWLAGLAAWIDGHERRGLSTVMACSALRRRYRDALRAAAPDVVFVHLNGSPALIAQRMENRTDHFMPPDLLSSQYAALEALGPGEAGLTVDALQPPARIVAQLAARFARTGEAEAGSV